MRSILILTVMLLTKTTWAENWQPLVVCDGGAAVLDVNADSRTYLQLLIRNQNILSYLHQVGAVSLKYGQNELILRGQQERGVFSPQDFKGATNYGNVTFYRDGNGIKLVFSHDTKCWTEYPPGSSCRDNPLSMACESAGTMKCERGSERANWYFQSCRSVR
jgi:hypothetical protein